jgi:hypothetical protein
MLHSWNTPRMPQRSDKLKTKLDAAGAGSGGRDACLVWGGAVDRGEVGCHTSAQSVKGL